MWLVQEGRNQALPHPRWTKGGDSLSTCRLQHAQYLVLNSRWKSTVAACVTTAAPHKTQKATSYYGAMSSEYCTDKGNDSDNGSWHLLVLALIKRFSVQTEDFIYNLIKERRTERSTIMVYITSRLHLGYYEYQLGALDLQLCWFSCFLYHSCLHSYAMYRQEGTLLIQISEMYDMTITMVIIAIVTNLMTTITMAIIIMIITMVTSLQDHTSYIPL